MNFIKQAWHSAGMVGSVLGVIFLYCFYYLVYKRPIDHAFLRAVFLLEAGDLIEDIHTGNIHQVVSRKKNRIKMLSAPHEKCKTVSAKQIARKPVHFEIIKKTDGKWVAMRHRFTMQF